jgi:hypothetical protein
MCDNTYYEGTEEEAEIDEKLMALWSQWKQCMLRHLSDAELAHLNWSETFCEDVRRSVNQLNEDGKLDATTRDQNRPQE